MLGMNGGFTLQPPIQLTPQVAPFWPMLSQAMLQYLQQRATMGGVGAEFWTICQYNNFQNPVFTQLMSEALYSLNQLLVTQPSAAQNPTGAIDEVAKGVSTNASICWGMTQPHICQMLTQSTNPNDLQNAVNQYKQGIMSAMSMYNPMQNGMFGQPGFGTNVNMGGNMMNTAMMGMGGMPGQMTPQQMAMAMIMGQQQQNGFNPNAFMTQMNNNQYNGAQHGFQTGWSQQNTGVLNAGRTNTLAATTGGAVWGGASPATVPQQQQPQANWTASANPNSGNFQRATNDQSHIPNNFGQNSNAVNTGHQSVNVQQVQSAPLQPISGNPNVTTITGSNLSTASPGKANIKLCPKDRITRIVMRDNLVARRPVAYNVDTHASVCVIDSSDVIVTQELIPISEVKERCGVDFNKHNTAKFFTSRGATTQALVPSPTAVSDVAVSAIRQSYLDTILDKIKENNDVSTLDSKQLTKLFRDESKGTAIVIDKCIAGYQSQFHSDITNYICEKGVDVLVDSQIVAADLIELNTTTLDVNAQDICHDIRNSSDAVTLQNRFNSFRKWIGSPTWIALDNAITNWINNELYTNFGLALSIDSFAADIVELMEVMGDKDIAIADRNRMIANIANKFFTVYSKTNIAGERIDLDLGENTLLGTLCRYVYLPIQSVDLQLAGGVNCVLISNEAMPELFRLCSTQFTNIPAAQDSTAYNYLVTLDGERVQVNKPYGLPYFTLTRVDATFVNPLIKNN